VIEVEGLLVRFSGVAPIDRMSVTFPGGTCGLIGPNGAGKTTFFNVLSGFVKPAAGTIRAFGEDLLKMADYKRARWGLRRTFQTEQAIEQLSVFDNVALIYEHSASRRGPGPRWEASARASDAASRSLGRSSATPASSCSTSPPPVFPRRRRST
jgi:ABC-type branched-subunit amino acid transport system ATPase component